MNGKPEAWGSMHVGCMTHEGATSWVILGGVRAQ